MAFRRSIRKGGGLKRSTDWSLGIIPVGGTVVPAASKLVVGTFTSATLATLVPATVIRVRGMMNVYSDQVAATEHQVGAMGFGFVNEVAATLGITGLPGPSTDALWDGWFVHQFITQRFHFADNTGLLPYMGTQYVIDSKAMRKFESDEALVVVVENTSLTQGFEVQLGCRILTKAG